MENEKKKTTKKTTTKKAAEVVSEVMEEISEDIKEEVKSVKEEKTTGKEVAGTVVNCERLNIRKSPELGNNIIGDILVGRKVLIDIDENNDQFYKVLSETGLNGYCMKEYIKID